MTPGGRAARRRAYLRGEGHQLAQPVDCRREPLSAQRRRGLGFETSWVTAAEAEAEEVVAVTSEVASAAVVSYNEQTTSTQISNTQRCTSTTSLRETIKPELYDTIDDHYIYVRLKADEQPA